MLLVDYSDKTNAGPKVRKQHGTRRHVQKVETVQRNRLNQGRGMKEQSASRQASMGNETGGHAQDRQHPRAPNAEAKRPHIAWKWERRGCPVPPTNLRLLLLRLHRWRKSIQA